MQNMKQTVTRFLKTVLKAACDIRDAESDFILGVQRFRQPQENPQRQRAPITDIKQENLAPCGDIENALAEHRRDGRDEDENHHD
jgi:hypothetical protein